MNETQNTVESDAEPCEETGGEWLTVSQAARALGISERQARRYAGRLAPNDRREGEKEAGHASGARPALVRLDVMRALRASSVQNAREVQQPDVRPDIEPDARPALLAPDARPTPDTGPDMTPDTASVFTAHLLAENAFLRGQIEGHARAEAELRAALREALRAMPKQIEAGSTVEIDRTPQSASNASQTPQGSAAGKMPGEGASGTRREMRPLWKVVLGVR